MQWNDLLVRYLVRIAVYLEFLMQWDDLLVGCSGGYILTDRWWWL